MGVAGSLASVLVETSFHLIDTVNIRSKAAVPPTGDSIMTMVSKIWAREGLYGFCKGFSACFYSSVASGFIYFSIYKYLKGVLRVENGGEYD